MSSNYSNNQQPTQQQSTFAPQEQQYGGAEPQGFAGARGSGVGQHEPSFAAENQGGFANGGEGRASGQQGFSGRQQGTQGQTGQYNPSHGTGVVGTAAEPEHSQQGEQYHQHGENDRQRKHSPISDLKNRIPHESGLHSLDGVGGGYGAGVAGKHDGLPFIKHNDTSSHDPTLEQNRQHHHHAGQHEGVEHQQGGGVGSGLPAGARAGPGVGAGAGLAQGHEHGARSTAATPGHEQSPNSLNPASSTANPSSTAANPSSPSHGTSQSQSAAHKPSFLDKAIGATEIAVGKVTKDTTMIEEGQARKTGVQTNNSAALGKEGSHAYGVEGERDTERRREDAPRGAAGLVGTTGQQHEGLGREERGAYSAGNGGR